MATKGITRGILDWVRMWQGDGGGGFVELNALTTSATDGSRFGGKYAVNIESADRLVSSYIDGTQTRVINLMLTGFCDYSAARNDVNMKWQELFESWCDWVDDMEASHFYPDLGIGNTVTEIRVVQSLPTIALVTLDGRAKYQFQIEIEYQKSNPTY